MKNLIRNNWLSILIIVGSTAWACSQASDLPAQLPSHFDIHGNPDGFQNKEFALLFMPILNLFVVGLIGYVGQISPEGYQMPNSRSLIGRLNLGVTCLLTAIYVGMILEGRHPGSGAFGRLIIPGFALFMIFIGNYFGKLERNFFIGIRVPWTLASEDNWKRTHRFSGKIFVVGGILMLALSITPLPTWFAFAVLMAATLLSVAYSFVYFIRHEKLSNDTGSKF